MTFVRLLVLSCVVVLAAPAWSADTKAGANNMEILRDKVKADKKLLVAANMNLTEDEAKKFWPIYEEYQKDLSKINQHLATTIKSYADAYNTGNVPDAAAGKLVDDALSADASQTELMRKYVPKLNKVLPAAKTARYLQIERKIRAAVNYELASNIPLIE